MIIVTTTITNVQKVSTGQLLRNTTGINVAFPGFVDALINAEDMWVRSDMGTGFDAERRMKNTPYLSTYDTPLRNYYDDAL
ncbi:hypothetical protein BST46_30410, partial [Mycobacterium timonense]